MQYICIHVVEIVVSWDTWTGVWLLAVVCHPGMYLCYLGILGYLDRGMVVYCSMPSQDVPGIVMGY